MKSPGRRRHPARAHRSRGAGLRSVRDLSADPDSGAKPGPAAGRRRRRLVDDRGRIADRRPTTWKSHRSAGGPDRVRLVRRRLHELRRRGGVIRRHGRPWLVRSALRARHPGLPAGSDRTWGRPVPRHRVHRRPGRLDGGQGLRHAAHRLVGLPDLHPDGGRVVRGVQRDGSAGSARTIALAGLSVGVLLIGDEPLVPRDWRSSPTARPRGRCGYRARRRVHRHVPAADRRPDQRSRADRRASCHRPGDPAHPGRGGSRHRDPAHGRRAKSDRRSRRPARWSAALVDPAGLPPGRPR